MQNVIQQQLLISILTKIAMGNVGKFCGNETIIVDREGLVRTIPQIPFPRKGFQTVQIVNGPKTVVNFDNNILFKPESEAIVNKILSNQTTHVEEIAQQVQKLNSIKDEGDKLRAIHYVMKADTKTEQQIKLETQQVEELIMNPPKDVEPTLSIKDFEQINDGFKSVGIDMDWTHKRGVQSALSIHVLSGLTGNMARCSFKQTDQLRQFQYLIKNKALLNQHYQQIKKKIATKFGIQQDKITIVEIEKGSVKTTFVVNILDLGIDPITKKSNIMLSSHEDLQIHSYFQKFKLSPEDFDPPGNRDYTAEEKDLTQEQKFKNRPTFRAKLIYNKPLGCKRYGLNVWDRYDDGNNDWIDYQHPKEWAIAYHGVNSPGKKINIKVRQPFVINSIMKQRLLKAGARDLYKDCKCITPGHAEGCRSPVGGIYLTPDIQVAMSYAESTAIQKNGKKYRLAFQCRVHPDYTHIVKIGENVNYWIVSESKYIRPYAIILRQQTQR